jgi:hypothetical protein
MVVVDDGCPEESGRIAERILESEYRGDDVQVLFLERGIAAGHPATPAASCSSTYGNASSPR